MMTCVRKSATPWRWLVAVSALVTVTLSHPDTPLETLHTLCTLCNSVPVAPGRWSPIIRAADSETLSRHLTNRWWLGSGLLPSATAGPPPVTVRTSAAMSRRWCLTTLTSMLIFSVFGVSIKTHS